MVQMNRHTIYATRDNAQTIVVFFIGYGYVASLNLYAVYYIGLTVAL